MSPLAARTTRATRLHASTIMIRESLRELSKTFRLSRSRSEPLLRRGVVGITKLQTGAGDRRPAGHEQRVEEHSAQPREHYSAQPDVALPADAVAEPEDAEVAQPENERRDAGDDALGADALGRHAQSRDQRVSCEPREQSGGDQPAALHLLHRR